ncbi:hypothetical protein AB0D38_28065 [Streptomyces sp. NPDC048279]|uniref:hypothetical protein n=1 Tax=unclassified Streptomyces TaxID=2593676 RepID=UPI00341A6622
MRKAIAAGALALVSAAGCLVLAPAASAAPAACVTVTLKTGAYQGVGGTATKSSSSSCGDLNLTYSDDSTSTYGDEYAGRLYHSSSSSWVTCNKGYVWASDGSHSVNDSTYWLCTDVSGGTKFTVASYYDGGDTVHITH